MVTETNHGPLSMSRYLWGILNANGFIQLTQFFEHVHIAELEEKTQQAVREVFPVDRANNVTHASGTRGEAERIQPQQ